MNSIKKKKKRVSFSLLKADVTSDEEDRVLSEEEKYNGEDMILPSSDEEGVMEGAKRQFVLQESRKKKKSGGFQSMGLSYPVYKGILKKGYRVPTPIQRKTIPLILDGKDVVAMARTGSGKTAAFLLPLFDKLKLHATKIGIRSIILSPTRELASQTMKFIKDLGRFTGLRSAIVLGGDSMDDQFTALHENPDIVVATPGRFLHLVMEMDLKLSSVEYIVFDEADRLFEMGFSEQLREIIKRLPEMRQTLLFSATLPKLLVEFAKAGLKDPVLIRLDVDNQLNDQLRTGYFHCRQDDKPGLLLHFLHNIIPSDQQTVVFVATKHDVEYLRQLLLIAGIDSSFVYSSLDQTARKISVGKFFHKKTHVMIVTDVAARGIDIPLLDNVINYNFPSKPKLFVHRVGRVARAGRSGTAYSFLSSDEVPYLLDLHLFLGKTITMKGKDGLFGSVPQSLIDNEEDLLRHTHLANSDLISLKQVAVNGMKHYIRSRNQPAMESIRRSKQLPLPLPTHPLFKEYLSSSEIERNQLLDSLKSFKPTQTIFEVNSTVKCSAKGIMRHKRNIHTTIVSTERQRRVDRIAHNEEEEVTTTIGERKDINMATEEELDGFQNERDFIKAKKKANREEQPYIRYTPSDHHSEKGLSVDSNNTVSFDQQVSGAVLDIMGDEKVQMKKSNHVMKWDRKRKRYVNEGGKEGIKKMKTESGSWISSSYKSGRYKKWKSGNKQEGVYGGEEDEGGVVNKYRGGRGIGGRNKGGVQKGRMGKKGDEKQGRLKNVNEIMKKREKMNFMKKRRNDKGKGGTGGKGKGGGRTMGRKGKGKTMGGGSKGRKR